MSKAIQSGGFLGSLLSKLPGPLMKVAVPLAKKHFGFTRNNCYCFSNWCRISKGNTWFWKNYLIISNEEMNDILKIVQVLKVSNILLKEVTKTMSAKSWLWK